MTNGAPAPNEEVDLSQVSFLSTPVFSQGDEWRRTLVEKVAAGIAIVITSLFALFIISDVLFWIFGRPNDAAEMLRSVSAVLGPFVGGVLGYYLSLGRSRTP